LRGYSFLEHISDALVEAYGSTLEEAFSNAAKGLVDTMVDIGAVKGRVENVFTVEGRDLEGLLYNWLETVLVKVTSEGLVFSDFRVEIKGVEGGYRLRGVGVGEPLDPVRHKSKTEVKAVTYHMMEVKAEGGMVTVRFLLDL